MPEWKNITKLSDKAVKYFEGRMIKQEALNKMKIYSDIEFMPQFNKEVEVICFPYFFDGRLVNIKYRGPKKSFKLVAGAELIFYNQDVLREYKEVIITEGEIDTLSFITQGYFNVMSVPNGAGNKLEYLDPYIELFNGIEKIYLATDSDTRGIELRDELIRRLGAEKCYLINFKDCKDANEFLCKYGPDFYDLIPNAQPVPLKGIVSVDNIAAEIYNLYEEGIKPGVKIGLDKLDNSITWELGRLCMVTGIPSSGKSEFVDFLVTRLNILYGWKAAYFTPENYPLKYHYAKLFEKIIGKEFKKSKSNDIEYDMAYEYIRENFFYILNEEDLKLSTILTSAKILVKTRGIKILVIDPWNKIDHQFSDSETRYISRALDEIINLAKFSNLLIFLVAHPTKMAKGEIPSLYNISGSAHFFNKPDY
ncbi:MAG: toprim domain-containing protein, partial [Bacteroidales bacterium]|nr:toprim domain-containing protein [Bacteroidales bacterium]